VSTSGIKKKGIREEASRTFMTYYVLVISRVFYLIKSQELIEHSEIR
jgi:hypothetical protein